MSPKASAVCLQLLLTRLDEYIFPITQTGTQMHLKQKILGVKVSLQTRFMLLNQLTNVRDANLSVGRLGNSSNSQLY